MEAIDLCWVEHEFGNISFKDMRLVKRFKYIFPEMIAAAVRGGTELKIVDCGKEHLNEFAANEIEKAGVHID